MARLLHLVINECVECPHYEKSEKNGHHCAAPNYFVKLINPKEIPAHCPLPTTNEGSWRSCRQ